MNDISVDISDSQKQFVQKRFREVQRQAWENGKIRCRLKELRPGFFSDYQSERFARTIDSQTETESSNIRLGERPGPYDEYARKNIPGLAELQLSEGLYGNGAIGRRKDHHFNPISTIMAKYVRDTGIFTHVNEGSLRLEWSNIVGAQIAQHTRIEQVENGVIVIRCDSTQWAAQLKFLIPQLMKKIETHFPKLRVQKLIVLGPQVPSWKAGIRSVKGRGVRDTYG